MPPFRAWETSPAATSRGWRHFIQADSASARYAVLVELVHRVRVRAAGRVEAAEFLADVVGQVDVAFLSSGSNWLRCSSL
ncbi:MAG TPA: hypothetical protein VKI65_08600 [Gemmataceae bacterium]|nr:hypothetical protein [Gemmataceae bacterium]